MGRAALIAAVLGMLGSGYAATVRSTPGLSAYWRLDESTGTVAHDATGNAPGTFAGGPTLGARGALSDDPDTAVRFDGVRDEMRASAPIGTTGTIEGWFFWEAGPAILRDSSDSRGWILAFDDGGRVAYRVAGTTYLTPLSTAAVRFGWHHVVLTVDGAGATVFSIDGAEVQRGPPGPITPPAMPWHVMRNGTTTQYARGRADEVAVYDAALSPDAIRAHFEAGRDVGDTTAPAPPTGLRATARLGRIQLDWSNVSAPDLDGYDVYRSTDPAGPFTRVNPSRLSTSEYVDGTVTGGVASTYIVAASDEANNRSAFSEPVTATPLTTTDLLRRYAPQLRFELQESYFADSAAEMTDNFVPGQRQNVLVRADGTRLAAANPADPLANLSLGYLGDPRYADGRPARETDFINAANRTYQRDVQRLRAAGYGDRVYGRALTAGGKTWLQYWRFSYYNPQNVVGYGVHEGDWEFTQIGLDADGTPDVATYGQHAKAERCPWGSVQKTGGVPVVYVALASHASYFSAGVNRRGALPDDDHRGRGYRVRPALEVVTQATPLMAWRGRWGGSKASPKAPRRQAKWGAPNSYNAAALPCTIRSGPAVGAPRGGPSVPAPSLDVARSGDRVVVRYAFQRLDGRLTLVVSVARQDAPDVAAARRVRVRRETGVAALDLPAGASGRYVVSASAFDAEGGRSDVVRAPVR